MKHRYRTEIQFVILSLINNVMSLLTNKEVTCEIVLTLIDPKLKKISENKTIER